MRVALVDPSLFTLPYDGALARGLGANGHQVTLYGRQPRACDGQAAGVDLHTVFYRLSEHATVQRLPHTLRLAVKGLDHAAGMVGLLRRLRRDRPDVIHFQWLPLPIIDGALLGAFAHIAPLVLTVHDTDPFNGSPTARLQKFGVTRSFAAFRRLITHTRQGQARLAVQGIAPRRIAVLPHGPLVEPVAGGPQDRMTGPLTLTLFGKIKPYKGADVLIRAFAALPEDLRTQATVRIVGQSYMDHAALGTLAASLGIGDRVVIEDRFVSDEALGEVFAAGTVALFPYREIEASGVLSIAMAHGRPVIASRVGNFAETLTDGLEGLLVAPGDAAALTTALARMIGDRAFAAACAQHAGAAAASTVGWNEIAKMTVAVYEEAARRDQPLQAGTRVAITGGSV